MSENKISIIVPVYNVENYLKRCIDAVINQTYKNFELLLIDDKSTDKSKDIIKEYSNKYENIIGIFQETNQGVSVARNRGIENATGEWIAFCDGDDWYEPEFLEKMLLTAIKNNSDYIICDYFITSDTNKIKSNSIDSLSGDYSKKNVVTLGSTSSCVHLIKRNLIVENNLKYPIGCKQFEELAVIPVAASLCEKVSVLDEALYNYYQRGNASSASNSGNLENYTKNFKKAFSEMKKLLNDNFKEELEYHAIYAYYGEMLMACKLKMNNSQLSQITKKFKQAYPNVLQNKYFKNIMFAKKIFVSSAIKEIFFICKIVAKVHEKFIH